VLLVRRIPPKNSTMHVDDGCCCYCKWASIDEGNSNSSKSQDDLKASVPRRELEDCCDCASRRKSLESCSLIGRVETSRRCNFLVVVVVDVDDVEVEVDKGEKKEIVVVVVVVDDSIFD